MRSLRYRELALGSLLTLAIATVGVVALAGPLNPPAGAVSSTYKTLSEVEPRIAINATNTPGDSGSSFKITQPGSYYFTSDLAGAASKVGISIAASDVTIDLNGFTLRGVSGSTNAIRLDTTPRSNICVRNGSITGWSFSAVYLLGSGGGTGYVVENIRAVSCGGQNIVLGPNARVSGCSVESAGSYGIVANSGRCVIESCVVRGAGSYGIIAFDNSVVRDCSVQSVSGTGILAVVGSLVTNSAAAGCTTGIYIESTSSAVDCIATSNAGDGFFVNIASTLRGCSASGNASGAHVFGSDNRIEANLLDNNARGLKVDNSGNIIVRNVASGNTTFNWDIAAGNALAPIVSATTNGAAVTGNTYSGSLGSTDPNANVTY